MGKRLKFGVFGGSFNPIHTGHLIMAQNALTELGLDKVLFVTSNQNPFKPGQKELDYSQRNHLVEKAIESNANFSIEVYDTKDKPSYTIDTIRYLIDKYPDVDFYFICGVDNLMELHLWKDFDQLAYLCTFAFVNRNDLAYHYIEAQVEFLSTSYEAKLLEVDAPNIQISATDIRNRVIQGKSIKYLVPESIFKEVQSFYQELFAEEIEHFNRALKEEMDHSKREEVRIFFSDEEEF